MWEAEREISFQPLLSALCLIELAIEVAKGSQRRPPRYFPLSAKSIPISVEADAAEEVAAPREPERAMEAGGVGGGVEAGAKE